MELNRHLLIRMSLLCGIFLLHGVLLWMVLYPLNQVAPVLLPMRPSILEAELLVVAAPEKPNKPIVQSTPMVPEIVPSNPKFLVNKAVVKMPQLDKISKSESTIAPQKTTHTAEQKTFELTDNPDESVNAQRAKKIITPPDFVNASYLNNPPPEYPVGARRLGQTGRLVLRVFVTVQGMAGQINLLLSSGYPALDQSAISAVKQWRFVAARQGTQPVSAWVEVPIEFKLNE